LQIIVISTGEFEGKEETPIAARLPIQLAPRFSINISDAKSATLAWAVNFCHFYDSFCCCNCCSVILGKVKPDTVSAVRVKFCSRCNYHMGLIPKQTYKCM